MDQLPSPDPAHKQTFPENRRGDDRQDQGRGIRGSEEEGLVLLVAVLAFVSWKHLQNGGLKKGTCGILKHVLLKSLDNIASRLSLFSHSTGWFSSKTSLIKQAGG